MLFSLVVPVSVIPYTILQMPCNDDDNDDDESQLQSY